METRTLLHVDPVAGALRAPWFLMTVNVPERTLCSRHTTRVLRARKYEALKNTNNPGSSQLKFEKAPTSTCCGPRVFKFDSLLLSHSRLTLLLSTMSDMVNFVDEQEARMNLPDEAFEDYIARMVLAMNKYNRSGSGPSPCTNTILHYSQGRNTAH